MMEQKRQQRGRERGKEIVRRGGCAYKEPRTQWVLNKCPFLSLGERRQVRKKVKKPP